MLLKASSDRIKAVGGRVEGHFDHRTYWSPVQTSKGIDTMRMFLGDEVSGPLVWLLAAAPVTFPEGETKPDFRQAQAHYHRSPTFRVAVGPQDRKFKFDQQVFVKKTI